MALLKIFKSDKTKSKSKDNTDKESIIKETKETLNLWSKSKEDLRAEHEAKSDELEELREQYRNIYKHLIQLQNKFRRSKWKPTRYRRLKRMIKRCNSNETSGNDVIEEEFEEPESKQKGISEQFLENAKKLSEVKKELHNTKKEEFVEKNTELTLLIQEEKQKCDDTEKRIKRLKDEYMACKRYKFLQKYFVMKEIIKSTLRDTSLQE